MSGSLRLRYIGTLKWSDIKYLPDLSDQPYDRNKPLLFRQQNNIYKNDYHHSSSYCIRFLWAGNEKNLIFLIWKFFPDLLTSWVNYGQIFITTPRFANPWRALLRYLWTFGSAWKIEIKLSIQSAFVSGSRLMVSHIACLSDLFFKTSWDLSSFTRMNIVVLFRNPLDYIRQ